MDTPETSSANGTAVKGPNGLIGRLRAALELIDSLGERPHRLAIALLIVGLLFYSGAFPSSITGLEAKVDKHMKLASEAGYEQAKVDAKLASILETLAAEMRERNRRDKLRECAEIRDLDLRRTCLQ